MNAVAKLTPRVPRHEEPASAERTSAVIRVEIAGLRQEHAAAKARLVELEAGYDRAVLAGDAEAERHEAETARTRRTLRRAELRLPPLEAELAEAEAREEAARRAKAQAEAEIAVQAVLNDIEADYRRPAGRIAAFLRCWAEASEIARAAGIPGPDARLRIIPGRHHPARTEEFTVYIDEQGQETSTAYPPGSYQVDEASGRPLDPTRRGHFLPERPKRIKTRHIPASREPDQSLTPLPVAICLPGAAAADPNIWPPQPDK